MTENDVRARFRALVHPVRLRVVAEFCGRALTTRHLAHALPDVPQATLYRHVRALVHGGVLEVVGETARDGAVERTYRVVDGAGRVGPAAAAALTGEEHVEAFSVFAASLIETVAARLRAAPVEDVIAAGLSYGRTIVHLTADERERYGAELRALIERMQATPPGPGRSRYTLASVAVPHDVAHTAGTAGTDEGSGT